MDVFLRVKYLEAEASNDRVMVALGARCYNLKHLLPNVKRTGKLVRVCRVTIIRMGEWFTEK